MKTKDILKFMACTAAILTTAACSTDISPVDDPGEVKIMLTANVGSTTRTTTTDLNVSHIAQGTDNVGVFIQKEGATSADGLLYNIAYSSDGSGGLTASTSSIYFPMDGSRVNIYACAPSISTSSPDENVTFSIATNQSSDADYIASDLMIGLPAQNPVAKTTSAIPLTFGHKMAKIIVDFTGMSEDLTGLTLTTCDLFTSANVNIKNNTITTDETATKPITIASIDAKKTAACVIPPQTVAAGTKLLCLDYHGIKTYYTTPADITFESGKVYTFNMSKLTISTINLANLTGDVTLSMDCTITGTTSKKITIADGVKVTLDNAIIEGNQIVCQGDATIYLKGTNKVTSTNSEEAGIEVGPIGTTLTINGDADGSIEVIGGSDGAGIGSGGFESSCGNITITGGTVTATGGDRGAGIGSGRYNSSCGNISITGGTVTATGGNDGAGIGSGYGSSCSIITITGGTVNATGGDLGAGIGSGSGDSSCDNITITGGTVTATGGDWGAGIGSGFKSSCSNITITGGTVTATGEDLGAGIGSGYYNSFCGDITIKGGTVTAAGGRNHGAGIGSGYYNSSCDNISIDMTGQSGYSIKVTAGHSAYCIGKGNDSSAGAITITNATITLDDNSHVKYFNPTPTFVGTVVIKDTYDNDITGSITHN